MDIGDYLAMKYLTQAKQLLERYTLNNDDEKEKQQLLKSIDEYLQVMKDFSGEK